MSNNILQFCVPFSEIDDWLTAEEMVNNTAYIMIPGDINDVSHLFHPPVVRHGDPKKLILLSQSNDDRIPKNDLINLEIPVNDSDGAMITFHYICHCSKVAESFGCCSFERGVDCQAEIIISIPSSAIPRSAVRASAWHAYKHNELNEIEALAVETALQFTSRDPLCDVEYRLLHSGHDPEKDIPRLPVANKIFNEVVSMITLGISPFAISQVLSCRLVDSFIASHRFVMNEAEISGLADWLREYVAEKGLTFRVVSSDQHDAVCVMFTDRIVEVVKSLVKLKPTTDFYINKGREDAIKRPQFDATISTYLQPMMQLLNQGVCPSFLIPSTNKWPVLEDLPLGGDREALDDVSTDEISAPSIAKLREFGAEPLYKFIQAQSELGDVPLSLAPVQLDSLWRMQLSNYLYLLFANTKSDPTALLKSFNSCWERAGRMIDSFRDAMSLNAIRIPENVHGIPTKSSYPLENILKKESGLKDSE